MNDEYTILKKILKSLDGMRKQIGDLPKEMRTAVAYNHGWNVHIMMLEKIKVNRERLMRRGVGPLTEKAIRAALLFAEMEFIGGRHPPNRLLLSEDIGFEFIDGENVIQVLFKSDGTMYEQNEGRHRTHYSG